MEDSAKVALRAGCIATTTELGARFRQIATTEGVPAAVRWRSAQLQRIMGAAVVQDPRCSLSERARRAVHSVFVERPLSLR